MGTSTTAIARGIHIQTPGLHHVALRSSDLARSRVFYIERLGFPVLLDLPELLMFGAGGNAVVVNGPDAKTQHGDSFDRYRVGLDHMALACTDENELRRVASELTSAGIENTGVRLDPTLGKNYVAFKDPDGISWELYMA
ncbi:MAG: VOC family protein [Gemmatimonadota bacterium]|nr:VOC family protein [Gemmatimonadota bacterium]